MFCYVYTGPLSLSHLVPVEGPAVAPVPTAQVALPVVPAGRVLPAATRVAMASALLQHPVTDVSLADAILRQSGMHFSPAPEEAQPASAEVSGPAEPAPPS